MMRVFVIKAPIKLEALSRGECVFLVNGKPRPKSWIAKPGEVVVVAPVK